MQIIFGHQHHKRKDNWTLCVSQGMLTPAPIKRLPEYLIELGQASRSNYQFTGGKVGQTEEHVERHHINAGSKMQTVGNTIEQMTQFLKQMVRGKET